METYKLIDGEHSAEDAREVLGYLLDVKIKFLCRKRFSMQERNEGDTSHVDKRIAELQQTKEDVSNALASEEMEGKTLRVDCDVRVTPVEEFNPTENLNQV